MTDTPSWLMTFQEYQTPLWVVAVVFYGLGDTATTAVGLQRAETAEAGPVAAVFVESAGITGLLSLKLVLFAIAALAWYLIQSPSRVAIPLAIALAGVLVTVWNAVMLFI